MVASTATMPTTADTAEPVIRTQPSRRRCPAVTAANGARPALRSARTSVNSESSHVAAAGGALVEPVLGRGAGG
jgi:hypothetical protein